MNREELKKIIKPIVEKVWYTMRSLDPVEEQTEELTEAIYQSLFTSEDKADTEKTVYQKSLEIADRFIAETTPEELAAIIKKHSQKAETVRPSLSVEEALKLGDDYADLWREQLPDISDEVLAQMAISYTRGYIAATQDLKPITKISVTEEELLDRNVLIKKAIQYLTKFGYEVDSHIVEIISPIMARFVEECVVLKPTDDMSDEDILIKFPILSDSESTDEETWRNEQEQIDYYNNYNHAARNAIEWYKNEIKKRNHDSIKNR